MPALVVLLVAAPAEKVGYTCTVTHVDPMTRRPAPDIVNPNNQDHRQSGRA